MIRTLRHNHQYWESGTLRCILVAEKSPAGFVVQVLHRDAPVIYERCDSAEDGDALAHYFWQLFVDKPSQSL